MLHVSTYVVNVTAVVSSSTKDYDDDDEEEEDSELMATRWSL